jgi:hypothetical protein
LTSASSTGVVGEPDRRRIGKRLDEIAPAQFDGIDLHLTRGGLDDALDDVRRFGPARAAIGVDGRGVGEDRFHLAVDRRRRVLPRQQCRVQDRRNAGRKRREVRTHVRRRVHAQRKEFAILVERKFGGRHMVAAMRVGQEALRALGCPLDRTAHPLAGPHKGGFFSVEIDLRPETAADVGRDHPHLVLRQAQHEGRHK